MMKNLVFWGIVFFMVSCRNAQKPSETLISANLAALEQTVDMESNEVEQDEVLKFHRAVIELGEIPLGESREVALEAVNRTDKPLVVLDAYTSCHCTKVAWDKKPIAPSEKTIFTIHFTAEQPGTFFKKIAVKHSAKGVPVTFAIQGVVANSLGKNK